MHDWQSLSHVRWDCKYHMIIVPKYRKRVIYGKLRRQIGPGLRSLCRQRGITLLESHAMPDRTHLCLVEPLKARSTVFAAFPVLFSLAHASGSCEVLSERAISIQAVGLSGYGFTGWNFSSRTM